jgi:general secretion pathway protein G
MKRRVRRRVRQGFTLLEVLLVLAILVILASTVTVYFARTQTTANTRAARVQITAIGRLLDQYRIDVGSYPNTDQGLAALLTAPSGLAQPDKWQGPYTQKQIPADPWGNPYQYRLENADQFMVYSLGPDGQDNSGDEVTEQSS